MKKIVTMMAMLMVVSLSGFTQPFIQGSIQMGSSGNQVDVLFQPNYDSGPTEYIQYLSISVAIPTASATGVTNPTITGVNNLAGVVFVKATPFSYTAGSETIYSWISNNLTVQSMSWANGVSFKGATITFTGGNAISPVRLVDFSNVFGGNNGNTLFSVVTTVPPFDVTNYSDFFYAIPDPNGSTEGDYANGDKYVETNSLISLPVGLVSFSGFKEGNKNTLRWTTANEANNLGFDVQRSVDGVNYSSIGFVNSQAMNGNSLSSLDYSFDDNNPGGRKQYYRLRQVDVDNRGKLSNIVVISGDKPLTLAIGGLFPNPANSLVNVIINVPVRDNVLIVISDITGKLIKQKQVNAGTGSNTVPVDISDMAKGSYLVIVKGEGNTVAGKFVKL